MLPAYCSMRCLAPLKNVTVPSKSLELETHQLSALIHLFQEISIYVTYNYHSRPNIFTDNKGSLYIPQ